MIFRKKHFVPFLVAGLAFTLASCGDSDGTPADDTSADEISIDDAASGVGENILKIDREIFSLPSPVQAALLLKKNAVEYDEKLLNPLENERKYINRIQKSLNLGVYGANMAYLSNFNNTQLKIDYYQVIDKLTEALDVRSKIDQSLLDRFAKNIEERDSLYALNAELFSSVDRYLKENDENHVAALVLTGGWVEALHLTMGTSEMNEEIRNRIGEQKTAVRSLKRLLAKIEDPLLEDLLAKLKALDKAFEEVSFSYEYVKPITDANERVTYLNSKSSVVMSDEQLQDIADALAEVRAYITQ